MPYLSHKKEELQADQSQGGLFMSLESMLTRELLPHWRRWVFHKFQFLKVIRSWIKHIIMKWPSPRVTTILSSPPSMRFLFYINYSMNLKYGRPLHDRPIACSCYGFWALMKTRHLSIYMSTLSDLLSYIPQLHSPNGFDVGKISDHCTSTEIGCLYVIVPVPLC